MAKVAARDRGVERTMERSYAPTGPASDDDGGDDNDSLVDNEKVVTEKKLELPGLVEVYCFSLDDRTSRLLSGSL